jgi:small-conductance mechanosensitive channel
MNLAAIATVAASETNGAILGNATWMDLLFAAIILIMAVVGGKALTLYLRRTFRDRMKHAHLEIMNKVIFYGLILGTTFSIFSTLGIDLSGLLVAGGVVGVIVGFASQRIIGNLISGIFLFIERPMNIGDSVNIDGQSGIVRDIRILSTLIRGFDGLAVRIPNEKVFTSKITNYVAHVARRFSLDLTIRYQDDADQALAIIKGLADDHPYILKNPGASAYVADLDENGVHISVLAWGPTAGWWDAKVDLLAGIRKAFEEAGVEIAAPRRAVTGTA